jgi:hypothetical protein
MNRDEFFEWFRKVHLTIPFEVIRSRWLPNRAGIRRCSLCPLCAIYLVRTGTVLDNYQAGLAATRMNMHERLACDIVTAADYETDFIITGDVLELRKEMLKIMEAA